MTVDTELARTNDTLRKLTSHVLSLAQVVYNKNGFYDEEMAPGADAGMGDIPPDPDAGMAKMPGEEAPLDEMGGGGGEMPYDQGEDEFVARAMYRMKKRRGVVKGFDSTAQNASNEEDAKFGEADSNIEGNEGQPSGDMGGNKEDETFGPGGEASRSASAASGTYKGNDIVGQLANITKTLEGMYNGEVISKAQIPGTSPETRMGNAGAGPQVVTRDMEEQAKSKSFKELNKFRTELGDLPERLV